MYSIIKKWALYRFFNKNLNGTQMFLNKTFPKGFYNLFFTEFGARFGFWGVQSILVLYLVKLFLISDTNSYSIAAAYSALTYCATFIGGTLADKLLGARKILLIGIVFSIVGLVFLSAPNIHSCYLGLAFLVVGMGFYMPTNASLLDHLYTKEDTAREKGYFYLYFATNIGGILGPILFGIAGQYYSYRLGLILYSIALFIMLLVCVIPMRKIHFLSCQKQLYLCFF
jgi:POT family proton-dependent oligopeptide transporter